MKSTQTYVGDIFIGGLVISKAATATAYQKNNPKRMHV